MEIKSGVDPSLHSIVITELFIHILTCRFFTLFHKLWHYKDEKRTLSDVLSHCLTGKKLLLLMKRTIVDEKVAVLNRSVLKIFNNFIPYEIIVCNDRNPGWLNDKIRLLNKEKTTTRKYFCQNGNDG